MMNLTKAGICLLTAGMIFTACEKKTMPQQVKSNGLPKADTKESNIPVAIVDIDTLASQYEYCKVGQKALESKQNSFRNQLNAKGQALQKAMESFQSKMQNGGFTSQQQVENAQAQLQRQQQALQNFQVKIENQMMQATQAYQSELRDSLNSFIKEYNKDGKFKVILSKSGDNVLYADPSVDITMDVIAGLNKRYKK